MTDISTDATTTTSLFAEDEAAGLRERWQTIQTGFVDQPRESVERADALVAEVMQHLTQTFSDRRKALETQWAEGDQAGTEELRMALQRYRSFFERLLST